MKRQLKQERIRGIFYMNKKNYIKDKWLTISIAIVIYFIILLILLAFKVNYQATIAISSVYLIGIISILVMEYMRKKKFYQELKEKLDSLDKKYLIVEMLNEPSFLEGKILIDSLYDIDKSMIERINTYKSQTQDFKEYVELWIHEVKLPVSSLTLMIHNHKGEENKKLLEQLSRLDNYLEQILYYVRSENAEKDYLIKKVNLSKVISNIALKNKDILLEIGKRRLASQVICGFAMETSNLIENAQMKLQKKNCDMIVANHLKTDGAGFQGDTNVVSILTQQDVTDYQKMSKQELAYIILNQMKKLEEEKC